MSSVTIDVEKAMKAGLVAQLATDGITDYAIRGFWTDDEAGTEEDREYPVIQLVTAPSTGDGGNAGGTLNTYQHSVNMGVLIATHIDEDPKRAALVALYNSVRTAIDSRNFGTDFTTISSGLTFDFLQVTGGVAGVGGDSDNASYAEMELNWQVCGTP